MTFLDQKKDDLSLQLARHFTSVGSLPILFSQWTHACWSQMSRVAFCMALKWQIFHSCSLTSTGLSGCHMLTILQRSNDSNPSYPWALSSSWYSVYQVIHEGLCSGDITEKGKNQLKSLRRLDVFEWSCKMEGCELKTERTAASRSVKHEELEEWYSSKRRYSEITASLCESHPPSLGPLGPPRNDGWTFRSFLKIPVQLWHCTFRKRKKKKVNPWFVFHPVKNPWTETKQQGTGKYGALWSWLGSWAKTS